MLHEIAKESIGGYAIGVDVTRKIIQSTQERYPEISLAWQTHGRLQNYYESNNGVFRWRIDSTTTTSDVNCKIGFDAVYVYVSSLSGSVGLVEALFLLSALFTALEPRYVNIKSLCRLRISTTLVSFERSGGKAAKMIILKWLLHLAETRKSLQLDPPRSFMAEQEKVAYQVKWWTESEVVTKRIPRRAQQ